MTERPSCAWTRINIVKTDYITKSNLLSQCDFIKTPMTFFTELKKNTKISLETQKIMDSQRRKNK